MTRTVAVVLNWRNASETLACVASLLAWDRPLDIVVLDNASGDGSLDAIWHGLESMPLRETARATLTRADPDGQWPIDPAAHRQILVIDTGHNGGYAFGNNIGMRIALTRPETAWLWVLNNDTRVPDAASLDALIARMEADPTIGICGATVVYAHDPDRIQTQAGGTFNRRLGRCNPIGFGRTLANPLDCAAVERDLYYVNGAAAFVRRSFVETVGLMTEDYFLYFEEFDWANRGRGKFRTGYAPDALVIHAVGATIGTDDFGGASPLSIHYMVRSRLLFLRRHFPASLVGAVLDLGLEAMRSVRQGRWRKAVVVARAAAGLRFRP